MEWPLLVLRALKVELDLKDHSEDLRDLRVHREKLVFKVRRVVLVYRALVCKVFRVISVFKDTKESLEHRGSDFKDYRGKSERVGSKALSVFRASSVPRALLDSKDFKDSREI